MTELAYAAFEWQVGIAKPREIVAFQRETQARFLPVFLVRREP